MAGAARNLHAEAPPPLFRRPPAALLSEVGEPAVCCKHACTVLLIQREKVVIGNAVLQTDSREACRHRNGKSQQSQQSDMATVGVTPRDGGMSAPGSSPAWSRPDIQASRARTGSPSTPGIAANVQRCSPRFAPARRETGQFDAQPFTIAPPDTHVHISPLAVRFYARC